MTNKSNFHREFNDTGVCVPHLHFMAGRSEKLNAIIELVEKGKYFTIDRPRQYGKTTILYLLEKELEKMGYLVIKISFEGIGDKVFSSEDYFSPAFVKMLGGKLVAKNGELADALLKHKDEITNLQDLSEAITRLTGTAGKKIVLQVDEVDKSSNNQLFLSFLGMLRAKYLLRNEGSDTTFHSVILAGVHDVKNLKLKIREEQDPKYNSPWNIAADFDINLSLNAGEIKEILDMYSEERQMEMDIPFFVDKLLYYTSGYPFLVSHLCKILDEKITIPNKNKEWKEDDLTRAIQLALNSDNTNSQSLIKNLANNVGLYEFVFKIVMNGQEFSYNPHNEIIKAGIIYGILEKEDGKVRIHNRFYEQLIYNYMVSNLETSGEVRFAPLGGGFMNEEGSLNIERAIEKFQEFMKEQFSSKDSAFIERNGRLLFLAFLRPIINGKGFDFKEVQISEEMRLDVVITFGAKKHIVELKKWYGEKAHQHGLTQLADYLERQNMEQGYLIVFDSRRKSNNIGKRKWVTVNSKKILIAWV